MFGKIHYLNTDLDLESPKDLTALAALFDSKNIFPLHVERFDDGLWHACFETQRQYTEPEHNITAVIAVIESLRGPHRTTWLSCGKREFNIGYDCGKKPWAFEQGLSAKLLGRIAKIGASLRITLYPESDDKAGIRAASSSCEAAQKNRRVKKFS
jgi:hypothetical protein